MVEKKDEEESDEEHDGENKMDRGKSGDLSISKRVAPRKCIILNMIDERADDGNSKSSGQSSDGGNRSKSEPCFTRRNARHCRGIGGSQNKRNSHREGKESQKDRPNGVFNRKGQPAKGEKEKDKSNSDGNFRAIAIGKSTSYPRHEKEGKRTDKGDESSHARPENSHHCWIC